MSYERDAAPVEDGDLGLTKPPHKSPAAAEQLNLEPGRASLAARPRIVDQIREFDMLTPAEEAEVVRGVVEGDEQAFETYFCANLRLVRMLARRKESKAGQLDFDDLFVAGCIGLIRAMGNYDPKQGTKLSGYAYPNIQAEIQRTIEDESRTVRIPVHAQERLAKLDRKSSKLEAELGRELTDTETEALAKELKIDKIGRTHKNTIDVQTLQVMSRQPMVSLDAPLSEENDTSLAESIPDSQSADPVDILDSHSAIARQAIAEVLDTLDGDKRRVFEELYGLRDGEEKTLVKVSEELGVSLKYVRRVKSEVEQIVIPSVRVKLAGLGLISEAEGVLAQQEVIHIAEKRPQIFTLKDEQVREMVEQARQLYDGSDLEAVEDFLDREQRQDWLSADQEAELLADASADSGYIDILKAEYQGLALIAATPYIQANPNTKEGIVRSVDEALERTVGDDYDPVTGAKLRNKIFFEASLSAALALEEADVIQA